MSTKPPDHRFSCHQCDFTTASSVVLRNHELVHSYTKTCPHCSKKFFQDSHMKFHLLKCGVNKNKITPPRIIPKSNKPQNIQVTPEKIVVKESPKQKKIKVEEEFLLEDSENENLLSNTTYEYTTEELEPEEIEPTIQSVCCDIEFLDLLSLLAHVHECHPETFSATMNAMQPIVEGTVDKMASEQDEVVFVQFDDDDEENEYSNAVYDE